MFGGAFVEQIDSKAFNKTLKNKDDVRALVEHEPSRIIARTKNGTLTLKTDKVGLRAEIQPSDTQTGRDVVESIRRGDLDQMSFGFRLEAEEWEDLEKGVALRTITQAKLVDVSVVAFAAYPQTEVDVRSFQSWQEASRRRQEGGNVQWWETEIALAKAQWGGLG